MHLFTFSAKCVSTTFQVHFVLKYFFIFSLESMGAHSQQYNLLFCRKPTVTRYCIEISLNYKLIQRTQQKAAVQEGIDS